MNKTELEILTLACNFLELRGFVYHKEMYDILNKMSRQREKRIEKSVNGIREKRKTNKNYARSKIELERKSDKKLLTNKE